MPAFDLHALLREGSASFHRRLDSLPQMVRLLSPTLSVAEYLACLRGLQLAHVPLEEAVEQYLAENNLPFDFSRRRKAGLLARDIAFYTTDDEPVSSPEYPLINDPARLVGTLYVIEGATLGGRMIARRIAKSIGAEPGAGADFFNVYGDQVDLFWHDLWPFFNATVGQAEVARALAAAGDCFRLFEDSLSRIEATAGV